MITLLSFSRHQVVEALSFLEWAVGAMDHLVEVGEALRCSPDPVDQEVEVVIPEVVVGAPKVVVANLSVEVVSLLELASAV
jgi:hypothetical protein